MIKDLCRFGSDMTKKRWKLWAIPGFLGLLMLALLSRCNSIENDLQQRTQAALTENGLNWAKVAANSGGRDLLLSGVAPSETAKDQAITLAQGVYGVGTLEHDITIKEYVSSVFKLKHSDNKVVLSGSLPNQSSIDLAINKAQTLYGESNVVNELSINKMALEPSWLAGATGLMAALYGADNLALNASDSHINITGTVATEEAKTQLLQQASASFGENFSEEIQVVKTPPTADELAAIEAARLAEEQRLIADAEAARLAEEKRLVLEAEATRLAEEQRLAIEVAEKQRLAAEAETAKLQQVAAQAEQQRLIAEKKAAQLVEEKRIAEEAEANRLAELKRQAEAARVAEEKRLAAEAEAARIAEEKRLALEAKKARLAEEKRLLEEAEAARIAEEKRLAEEAEATRIAHEKQLAEQNRQMLNFCQLKLNQLINNNPSPFIKDSSTIRGSGYGLLGMITIHVNSCSGLLHKNNQFIDVVSQAGEGETNPQTPDLGYARSRAIVSYLENINGIHPGLLRPRKQTSSDAIRESQLHFIITE